MRLEQVVVICTRNRLSDLSICLKSLEAQSVAFDKILIVDSSDKKSELHNSYDLNINYYHTDSGLTYQRNFAISKLKNENAFIHFIDDDVTLDSNYLHNFKRYLNLEINSKAYSGKQIILENKLISETFLTLFKLHGKVLFNGININPNYKLEKVCEIQWMPGCNMIIHNSIFQKNLIVFDEFNRSGYSMGEDVDMSIKLSYTTKILYLPECLYKHNLSPTNRLGLEVKLNLYLQHRLQLTRDYPSRFRESFFWLSLRFEKFFSKVYAVFSRKQIYFMYHTATKKFLHNSK